MISCFDKVYILFACLDDASVYTELPPFLSTKPFAHVVLIKARIFKTTKPRETDVVRWQKDY